MTPFTTLPVCLRATDSHAVITDYCQFIFTLIKQFYQQTSVHLARKHYNFLRIHTTVTVILSCTDIKKDCYLETDTFNTSV